MHINQGTDSDNYIPTDQVCEKRKTGEDLQESNKKLKADNDAAFIQTKQMHAVGLEDILIEEKVMKKITSIIRSYGTQSLASTNKK